MKHMWQSAGAILVALCVCMPAERAIAQAAPGAQNAAIEREFQAAVAAQDAGDLDKAESILTSLHTQHPGIFAVDESLGLVYVARAEYAKALPVLEAAVREAPESDAAYANLGAAYYQMHRNEEALKAFGRAAQLDPRNAATQQALGRLWLEKHEPARAAEAFGAALALKPGDSDLMMAHAQALMDAGQLEKATEQLGQVPDQEHSAAAQSLFGDVEEKAGQVQAAAEHYARAVELEPNEANVWALGAEFLRHWTFEPAIREFEAATVKFPESARMKMGLGIAEFGNGDFPRATQIFSGLLAADSSNAMYAEMLGLACTTASEGGQPQCSALIPFAQAHFGNAKVALYAAKWILKEAHTPERAATARRLLENAVAADPKLAEAQYHLGLMDQEDGQWARSIAPLEAAVQADAQFAEAHYGLGRAYWNAGRKSEAEEQMELYRTLRARKLEERDQKLSQITTLIVGMR